MSFYYKSKNILMLLLRFKKIGYVIFHTIRKFFQFYWLFTV